MTLEAPAASARATSRGWRDPAVGPDVGAELAGGGEHSSTAENCGRPTPVIIRVVHMAPGPDADLDDVGPGRDEVAHAVGGDDVARAQTGTPRPRSRTGRERLEHLLLVAVRGVDDEDVDPGRSELLGPAGDVAVDADGGRDAQLAGASTLGR